MDLSYFSLGEVTLYYYYERTGGGEPMDPGEYFFVEYYNGSSWTIGKTYDYQSGSATQYTLDSLVLPTAALHANFQFRFRSTGTGGGFDDYFVDNAVLTAPGAGYKDTIATNVPYDSISWDWILPFVNYPTCRVKIEALDGQDSIISEDESDSTFTIEFYTTLDSPNGGENWAGGSTHPITWTTVGEGFGSHRLLLSTNGGMNWDDTLIADIAPGVSTWNWILPLANSTNCKISIQVLDSADSVLCEDKSDLSFSIQTHVTMTTPDGGEFWIAESTHTVTWSVFGEGFDEYRLLFSTNSGADYPDTIVHGLPSTATSYDWQLPLIESFSSRVKAQIVDDGSVISEDASNSDFTIRPSPYIVMDSPNGAETWTTGSPHSIEWTVMGQAPVTYRLLLSQDNGTTYPCTVATGIPRDSSTWTWTPTAIHSNTCRIKAQILNGSSTVISEDISDSCFTIQTYPTLTSPNGGEVWAGGSTHPITWTTVGAGHESFRLMFTTTGVWDTVSYSLSSDHPYVINYDHTWEISHPGAPKMKIHFSSINTESGCDYIYVYDKWDNLITQYCGVHDSTWTPEVPGDIIKVRLRSDGTVVKYGFDIDRYTRYVLANIDTIAHNVPGSATSYDWVVPSVNNPICWGKIEMIDSLDNVISHDVSDNSFAIEFWSKLIYPNGGEHWKGGNTYPIRWHMTGEKAISSYKLLYSVDGGSTYPTVIVDAIPATDSTYDWPTPLIGSDSVRVKIEVLDASSQKLTEDWSDNDFEIDGVPPATVRDLGVMSKTWDSITLKWVTPGDDSMSGKATEYDMRYSLSPITEGNWGSTSQCISEQTPGVAGSEATYVIGETGKAAGQASRSIVSQTLTIQPLIENSLSAPRVSRENTIQADPIGGKQLTEKSGEILYADTPYYVAMKTRDNLDNWSALSNVVNCITAPYPALAVSQHPMFQHDEQHTGRSPYRGSSSDNMKWYFATSDKIFSSPVVSPDGTVYIVSENDSLYALYPDGTRKWAILHRGATESTPAIALDTTIYVGSSQARLYAYTSGGTCKWSYSTSGAIYTSPVIGGDGTIYFGTASRILYALTPRGKRKWSFTATGNILSSPALSPDGVIYFGCGDNKLYALAPDGVKLWDLSVPDAIESSPAVDATTGMIYVGASNGKLYAIRPNGVIKWFYATDDAITGSPAIGADGTLFFGSLDSNIYAVSTDNGELKWSYPTSGPVESSPIVDANGMVYIGSSDGIFYCLDGSNGSLKWQGITGNAICSSPAIGSDSTVYIGSNDGRLYAYGHSAPVTLIQPNGGEVLIRNTVYSLLWNATGNVSNIKLHYSLNSGTSWILMSDSEVNDGIYRWQVPDTVCFTCKAKVTAYVAGGDSAWDVSNDTFTIAIHGIENLEIPKTLFISQNRPNPFADLTEITYGLPQPAHVRIGIYNLSGQHVLTLVDNQQNAGCYAVKWDGRNMNGRDVGTGVYFYRLLTGQNTITKKMYLAR
jgi:outer membrane protein assembly factor BamB